MPKEGRTSAPHKMLQSAMEYLMTYGWAILIIAVVLGALYSLGVFNMSAYMPKIGPGACHVFRPNGPGTSWNVALTGSCAGYLPQYVAQFNGQTSYVSTGTTNLPLGSSARSVFAWIYVTGVSGGTYVVESYGTQVLNNWAGLSVEQNPLVLRFFAGSNDYLSTLGISRNAWHFVGYSYVAGANTVTVYVDGQSQTGSLSAGIALNTAL